jgi:hypothetical protein
MHMKLTTRDFRLLADLPPGIWKHQVEYLSRQAFWAKILHGRAPLLTFILSRWSQADWERWRGTGLPPADALGELAPVPPVPEDEDQRCQLVCKPRFDQVEATLIGLFDRPRARRRCGLLDPLPFWCKACRLTHRHTLPSIEEIPLPLYHAFRRQLDLANLVPLDPEGERNARGPVATRSCEWECRLKITKWASRPSKLARDITQYLLELQFKDDDEETNTSSSCYDSDITCWSSSSAESQDHSNEQV